VLRVAAAAAAAAASSSSSSSSKQQQAAAAAASGSSALTCGWCSAHTSNRGGALHRNESKCDGPMPGVNSERKPNLGIDVSVKRLFFSFLQNPRHDAASSHFLCCSLIFKPTFGSAKPFTPSRPPLQQCVHCVARVDLFFGFFHAHTRCARVWQCMHTRSRASKLRGAAAARGGGGVEGGAVQWRARWAGWHCG